MATILWCRDPGLGTASHQSGKPPATTPGTLAHDQLLLAQGIHHFAKYNVPMWALPHHTQFTGTSTLVAAAAAKHSIDTAAAAATHDGLPPVTLPVFIIKKHSHPAFSTLCVGCPLIQCLLGSPGWVHFQNYNHHGLAPSGGGARATARELTWLQIPPHNRPLTPLHCLTRSGERQR